jgi:hypothetical protein
MAKYVKRLNCSRLLEKRLSTIIGHGDGKAMIFAVRTLKGVVILNS